MLLDPLEEQHQRDAEEAEKGQQAEVIRISEQN
jgi:hypothetical protein